MIISKAFTEEELMLLEKMCRLSLRNEKFTDKEKRIIDGILENTLA